MISSLESIISRIDDDPVYRLSTLMEKFLVLTWADRKLRKTNPAFYLHLHSRDIRESDLFHSIQYDDNRPCVISLGYVDFYLKRYTRNSPLIVEGPLSTMQVKPGDFFYEFHVDSVRRKDSDDNPIYVAKGLLQTLKSFSSFMMGGKEYITELSAFEQQIIERTTGSILVGSISHLGRLAEHFDGISVWDASALPMGLSDMYARRIQGAVNAVSGTRLVRASDMRSVLLSPKDAPLIRRKRSSE